MSKLNAYCCRVLAVCLLCLPAAAETGIVEKLRAATPEELMALIGRLAEPSEENDEAILELLTGDKEIRVGRDRFGPGEPLPVCGMYALVGRGKVSPKLREPLFNLVLHQKEAPKYYYGWMPPSVLIVQDFRSDMAPFVIEKLESDDEDVRNAAMALLRGMARMGVEGAEDAKPAVEPLKEIFLKTGNPLAASALREILDEEIEPIALEGLQSEKEAVRWKAAGLLANSGISSYAALAQALTDDPSERVRTEAAFSMRFKEGEAVIAALEKALEDESMAVRSKAAFVLANYHESDAGAQVFMENLMGSKDPEIREEAAWGLYYVDPPGVEELLRQSLMQENVWEVKSRVAGALTKHGTLASLDALFKAFAEARERFPEYTRTTPNVARYASTAIENIVDRHPEESKPILQRVAKEGPEAAREVADRLLRANWTTVWRPNQSVE